MTKINEIRYAIGENQSIVEKNVHEILYVAQTKEIETDINTLANQACVAAKKLFSLVNELVYDDPAQPKTQMKQYIAGLNLIREYNDENTCEDIERTTATYLRELGNKTYNHEYMESDYQTILTCIARAHSLAKRAIA